MTTAERLRGAAFELFSVQGFEATTVDEIALRAGVGRTTYFRHFRTKEDVVFPDHAALAAEVTATLAAAQDEAPVDAVTRAALVVLHRYVGEGELARTRYRLVTSIERLRARELASTQPYQRAFGHYLRTVLDDHPQADLHAEVLAAVVIAAHNNVLRRWLRGDPTDPEQGLREVLADVFSWWGARPSPTPAPEAAPTPAPEAADVRSGSTIVVLDTQLPSDEVAALVRDMLTRRGAAQAPGPPA